jgi:hypothetical protein
MFVSLHQQKSLPSRKIWRGSFFIAMNKPAYTIVEQIALLKQRGMIFRDEAQACNRLKIIYLVNAYPRVPVYKYGFFNGWQTEPLWK